MAEGWGDAGTGAVQFPFLPAVRVNVPVKTSCHFSIRRDFVPQGTFGNEDIFIVILIVPYGGWGFY